MEEPIQYPDSPEYNETYSNNSDDIVPTSYLHSQLSSDNVDLTIVGAYDRKITLGRGGSSTIKIGRRNRQISRTHVAIEYNTIKNIFELTVLGLNGVCIDHVHFSQHGVAPLYDHSLIDVLGDHIHFRVPPPPLPQLNEEEQCKDASLEKTMQQESINEQQDEEPVEEQLVVEEEQPVQEQEEEEEEVEEVEEEDYPEDLVPNEALSPEEEELSPEPKQQPQQEDDHTENKEAATPVQENKEPAPVIYQEEQDYAEVIIDALGK
jgi:hypothetical protein